VVSALRELGVVLSVFCMRMAGWWGWNRVQKHVRKPKNRGQNNGAVTGFGGGVVHSPNLVRDQNDPVSVDRCAVCARMTHVECDQIASGVTWKN
jgi:hypothetical protein